MPRYGSMRKRKCCLVERELLLLGIDSFLSCPVGRRQYAELVLQQHCLDEP